MSDRVRITHPRHPGVVREVSRSAYERRSRRLGWQIATEAPPAPTPPPPIDEAQPGDEKARLQGILAARGVSFHHRLGVEKLRKLVEDTA